MTAMLENLWSPERVERWGWVLVHGLWQAAAVAALLAVLLRLLHKAGPNIRYALACTDLALMVALPLVTLRFLPVGGPVAEAHSASGAIVLPAAKEGATPKRGLSVPDSSYALNTQDTLKASLGVAPIAHAPEPMTPIPLRERIVSALEPALPYVVLGWLIGVFGLSAWHLGGWTQLQRLKRRMVREIGTPLQRRLEELGARLGLHRTVGLLESTLVEVPTVVGWVRPMILLPASALTGLHPEQLEAILAHELAHIRRYDYLVNMLQTVVEILGFYHPAVWWVSHRIRVERENCCDDVAVRVCGSPVQYARALACMEEIRHHGTQFALAATGGSLLARITRLRGRPAVEDRRLAWLPGLVALLVIVALLLPAALVLGTPQPSPAVLAATGAGHSATEPNSTPLEAAEANALGNGEPLQILLEFRIAKAPDDLRPDRAILQEVADALGKQSPLARALQQANRQDDMTLGEAIKRYLAPQPLSGQAFAALNRLLQSQRGTGMLAAPRVLTRDGVPVEMRIGNKRRLPGPAPADETGEIEYGTVVSATAHVLDRNRVVLELKTEVSYLIPGADANQPAVARTSAETSITAWNDRYLIWAAAASPAETATLDQGRESLYVMVKPVIQANGFAASPAGTPPTAPSPRQVVLDVRTVTLKQGDLLNVRVEWSWPKIQAGVFGNPGGPPPNAVTADGWPQGVQIGYTPDRTFTDALLAALDLLRKNNQATISTQQILVQEDCKAQIKALTEEWLPATAPTAASAATPYKIETGTILTVTPRIGDSNIMTLQISVESSDRVPMARGGSALPVITRRTTKNTVTLKDGGTVALAGVTTRPADPNDRTRYETAIFVTAHRVSDSVVIPPTRPSTETTVPATPTITATFAAADLLTVLKQIAECTDVKITPDLTVQTMPVTTELVEATPETALQQILKNTPYTSRKSDDGTYLVFRPLSFTFPDVNLVQALRDLSAAAEVPIIPDPDVTGTASSRLENVSLDEALQMLLAGKPYVFQRMPHYYLVAGPDIRSFRDDFPIETRRIRLHYMRPSRAKELLSPVFAPYVQVEPSRTRDPNDEGNTLLITAPPAVLDRIVADFKEIDRPRRQVFLDARIVVIKPNEIQRLPVEWDGPKVASAAFTDPANPNTATLSNNWPGGVRTGRTPDRVSTDSLMMALNQLQENGRADIIANPKVVALDGRQAQMKVIQEEWFMRTHPTIANSFPMREELQKVQSATVLTIIPHIRDDNDITLQVAMEVSDSIPKARGGSDRPLVTRRLAKDSVTVKDGGTVAVSGLTENRSKSSEKCVPGLSELRLIGKLFQNKNSDKPGREVVVFVTAHLIPEGSTHL